MSETGLADSTLLLGSNAAPQLVVGCYRLKFDSHAPVRFSDFPGSAWRGALGHSLARLACTSGARGCPPCKQPQACAYGYARCSRAFLPRVSSIFPDESCMIPQ